MIAITRRLTLSGALAALLALSLAPAPARAQVVSADTSRTATPGAVTTPETGDTTQRRPPPADTVRARGLRPGQAFLRSLVLPGWGQSSIGAPGRGAIYFALEAGSLWMVYKSDRKLSEARERERFLIETGRLEEGRTSGLVREREAQREDWITLSVFWLFFSGADAFVAAHLRDFDERVGVEPAPGGGLQLQTRIPVGND